MSGRGGKKMIINKRHRSLLDKKAEFNKISHHKAWSDTKDDSGKFKKERFKMNFEGSGIDSTDENIKNSY